LNIAIQKPIVDTLLELSFSRRNDHKSFNNCKFLN
jgi:hypothetical protein